MNKEVFLAKISELLDQYDKKTVIFEELNFRIDSKDWEEVEGKGYKENETKDVWEIVEGEFKGEQLFTLEAAMRETKKAGKIIPDKDELEELMTRDDYWKKMPKAGCRSNSNATLNNQGSYGVYWSSSVTSSIAFNLYFYSGGVNPADYNYRAYGFSVRCLEDLKN